MKKKILALLLSAIAIGVSCYLAFDTKSEKNLKEGDSVDVVPVGKGGGSVAVRDAGDAVMITADDLKKNFDQLNADAKKQPVLAFSLAKLLFECKTLASTLSSSEELIALEKVPRENKERLLSGMERKAARCEGLNEQQINSYVDMMDFAAQSGVVEAQLSYSGYVADAMMSPESIANPQRIVDYKRKSLEYYNRALGAGEVKALGLLASAYEDGILAEKDPYKAYVYAYTYAISKGGGASANQWLAQMEAALTASQLQSARSEAQQVYARCCR